MRPRTFTATAVLAVALGTTGCGLTEDGEEPERMSEEISAQTAKERERDVADGPLATRRGQIDGEPVILELTELERSGDTTALNIRVGVPRETDSSIGAQVASTFDDGVGEVDEGDGATSRRSTASRQQRHLRLRRQPRLVVRRAQRAGGALGDVRRAAGGRRVG